MSKIESLLEELGLPLNFDPVYEVLNFTTIEGEGSAYFHDFDIFLHEQLKNNVIYSVILGASGIAMVSLFIISKNKRTPVFILNQLSLGAMLLHALFYIVYSFGGANTITTAFTGFNRITVSNSDLHISSVSNVFQLLLIIFIECSLVFQVRTIFQSPNDRALQYILTTISGLIALTTSTLYFYNIVKAIQGLETYHPFNSKLFDIQKILFTVSVAFMSFLLALKLIRAIKTRRYLGLKQFDGFHILLITSTQSMIIPTVLMILSATVKSLSRLEFNALSNFFVAISLPLSSMWAASSNDSQIPTSTAGIFTPSSFTPSGKGTSYYSDRATTLKHEVDFERKVDNLIENENVFTPTTAAEEDAKRYWFNNPQIDVDLNDELLENEINYSSTHELNKY